MKTLLTIVAIFVTFQIPAFAQLPSDCTITKDYGDGLLAECPDGNYYFDNDGQRWINSANTPLRVPGWYAVN